jgi:hypothetical protein
LVSNKKQQLKLKKIEYSAKIVFRENKIKVVIFYCLGFLKIKINIQKTFINMRDVTILEYLIIERYLE